MKILVTGGAGFIGSHLCDRLLARGDEVVALDNLSNGRLENIAHNVGNPSFRFVEADLLDLDALQEFFAAESFRMVFHMAANSDLRHSVGATDLDLRLNVMTTYNVLESVRHTEVREIVFPSSSTVYGRREGLLSEDTGPLQPVSLYGAGKLAAEGFVSAFAHMFDTMRAWIFRFPNVVGSRMTHGCVYDFINRLRCDPRRLRILGDGRQEKPYVLVEEVVAAVLIGLEEASETVNCFNIGVDSATSVDRIADLVIEEMGLQDVRREYTGGESGWRGDVPRFQYDLSRIHALGWRAQHHSDEAIRLAARGQLAFIENVLRPLGKEQP